MGYVLDAARESLKPGSTVADVAEPMRDACAQLDPTGDCLTMTGGPAAKTAGLGLLFNASAEDGFNPAGEPSFVQAPAPTSAFRAGDVLWPDGGLGYKGMESDYGRTWIVGALPTSHQRDQFRRWLEVRDRTKELLRPGHTIADVVAVGRGAGGEAPWLSHLFLAHGTGLVTEYPFFGIDLESWLVRSLTLPGELRSIPREEEFMLTPGMVIVVEPVIWDESGDPGYRAEDTYLITESEPELLSEWSYAPFELSCAWKEDY
jgi:Xaa-Pro aminopeptidase